ncbi:MAG: hypothetical protein ACTSR7_16615 [Promethearchaeota archaeon]
MKSKKKQLSLNKRGNIKRIRIDWGRQGGVILAYIIVLLGYYGIIANIAMVDKLNRWISYLEMDRTILFWSFETYIQTYFLPALLLFFTCFLLTYKEDIPHYGIKASLWLVPFIIAQAFILYLIMFGLTLEPFIWQFVHWKGYFNIFLLYVITLSGALSGMKIHQIVIKRRKI